MLIEFRGGPKDKQFHNINPYDFRLNNPVVIDDPSPGEELLAKSMSISDFLRATFLTPHYLYIVKIDENDIYYLKYEGDIGPEITNFKESMNNV